MIYYISLMLQATGLVPFALIKYLESVQSFYLALGLNILAT